MKNVIIKYGHLSLEELPLDVRQKVEANEELLAHFKQSAHLTQMLQIKNYEKPATEVEGRIAYKLQTRLKTLDSLPEETSSPFIKNVFARYGIAAAFLALLAGNAYFLTQGGDQAPGVNTAGFNNLTPAKEEFNPSNIPEQQAAFEAAPIELASTNNFPINVGGPSGSEFVVQPAN